MVSGRRAGRATLEAYEHRHHPQPGAGDRRA